ncbi:MAG: 3-isopropylmalate dehydratase large subunit [bacterium]|nr:3-isopropylmalate dehydratase large subunit [bacterium]
MSKRTLYDKVWAKHKVATLPTGHDQLFIGLQYVHEVTSPPAFAGLREKGTKISYPERTFATVDHVIPTDDTSRPFKDKQAELMLSTLEKNVKDFDVTFFSPSSGKQGVVHIIGPEMGLTQPGMTIVCGDSHTCTHGAFGSLAFGIGTSEVQMVMETQTLAMKPFKVRQVNVKGPLKKGVCAKDIILKIIQLLGVKGGLGYAYEFTGTTIENLSMEDRLTICNMSIEAGARIGYINPDDTTFEYLRGREYAPKGEAFERAVEYWKSIASDKDAEYDDIVNIDANDIEPMVTWGITPGQVIGINENMPLINDLPEEDIKSAKEAYAYMKLEEGSPIKGVPVDVVFIGACTNGKLSDLKAAAEILDGKKVSKNIRLLVVPGSMKVKAEAEAEGLDRIFKAAGAEWREAGCSMCLAMNPDKLEGDQISASTSNRNFIGRQGSPSGRTLLLGPAMAAAAAVKGSIADAREFLA